MRIIAGRFKGHRLFVPKGKAIRPTSDRVREFLFSVLGNIVQDAKVLDLFAGTGSLGIEALSRGAKEATFVDRSSIAVRSVQRNLEKCHLNMPVHQASVQTFLKSIADSGLTFNLIFCDPPYYYDQIEKLLQNIRVLNILITDGLIVYESSSKKASPAVTGYEIIKQKEMGDTLITIYRLSNDKT